MKKINIIVYAVATLLAIVNVLVFNEYGSMIFLACFAAIHLLVHALRKAD